MNKFWSSWTDYFNLHYILWRNLTRTSNKLKVEPPLGTDYVRLSRVHYIYIYIMHDCTNPGRLVVRWRLTSVGLPCGTCFLSSSWRLDFWGCSYIFWKIFSHLIKLSPSRILSSVLWKWILIRIVSLCSMEWIFNVSRNVDYVTKNWCN